MLARIGRIEKAEWKKGYEGRKNLRLAEERRGVVRGIHILSTGTHCHQVWQPHRRMTGDWTPSTQGLSNQPQTPSLTTKPVGTTRRIFQYLGIMAQPPSAEERFKLYQWLQLMSFQTVEIQSL